MYGIDLELVDVLIIPLVLVIVEALKKSIGLNEKYAPIISLILGAIAAFIFLEADIEFRIAIGLLAGASASGLYSNVKAIKK